MSRGLPHPVQRAHARVRHGSDGTRRLQPGTAQAACLLGTLAKRQNAPGTNITPLPLAVYMTIKSYGCCSVLNTAGRLWLALLLVAGFGTALCVLCLPCLHSMDDVPKQGWGMRISDVCLARFARPLASQGLEAGARGVLTSASATSLAGAIVRKKSSMPEAPELQRRSDTIGAW